MPGHMDTPTRSTGAQMIASRYHDISCGHVISGHPGKCGNLHGHNYRITFSCSGLSQEPMCSYADEPDYWIDFSDIKTTLCQWLEDNWDHRFLVWENDSRCAELRLIDQAVLGVPFNPTAENMAKFLLDVVGPAQLPKGVQLTKVVVEETRKCSATAQ